MEQDEIFAILNRRIFGTEKAYLVRNIAENPERFLGVFRSTTPHLKLVQNILQSREIRFGDALEEIVRRLLAEMGFVNNPKREVTFPTSKGRNKKLSFDQYFSTPDQTTYYLVEQKVRDDHDSTKKAGQFDNFKLKLQYLKTNHPNSSVVGIMYFIDPSLKKNFDYYSKESNELSEETGIPTHILYNGEFFEHLIGTTEHWDLLRDSLLVWRDKVPDDVDHNCDSADEPY